MSAINANPFDHAVFESFVDELMKDYDAPGLCVGIISKGEVVYSKGFGFRNLEQKLPVTDETVFGIASVSKSFTALSIMQLAEKGLLSVEHPVKRYLPGFGLPEKDAEWKVSLHNFLTHTPAIPPLPSLNYGIIESTERDENESKEYDEDDPDPNNPSVKDTDSLLNFIANHDYRLLGRPGQHVSYSNDAFGLLGAIIESVSNKGYEEYLQENILGPLGMSRSTTRLDKIKAMSNVTSLYYKDKDDKLCVTDNWQESPSLTACGFIRSTVSDLLSYVDMYMNGGVSNGKQIASSCSISRMVTPYHYFNPDVWFGYGFTIKPGYNGATLIEHSGSLKGVASNIGYVPEKDIGVVVLCNLSGFPASKVWLGAVNLLLGLPVENPVTVKKVSPQPVSQLQKFAGSYISGEGANIEFKVVGENLEVKIDSKTYPVETIGPDRAVLTVKRTEGHLQFLFGPDGEVWGLRHGSRIIFKADGEHPVKE